MYFVGRAEQAHKALNILNDHTKGRSKRVLTRSRSKRIPTLITGSRKIKMLEITIIIHGDIMYFYENDRLRTPRKQTTMLNDCAYRTLVNMHLHFITSLLPYCPFTRACNYV